MILRSPECEDIIINGNWGDYERDLAKVIFKKAKRQVREEILPKKRYLEFRKEEREKGKKTDIGEVYNKVSGDWLGDIRWEGAWRQYIFDDDRVQIARGCHLEFAEFLKKVNDEHKQQLKTKKED